MSTGNQLLFPPFSLDVPNQRLQHGAVNIPLRPKTLSVLAHLVEYADRLVTKEELLAAVWPKAKVVDAALRVSIQEIRKALGDSADRPKFIKTVGKSGYRFIAPVALNIPTASEGERFSPFVGRNAEISQLRRHLESANGGKRQVIFVTGEPGIGKTMLVDAFSKTLPSTGEIVTTHGQCIEQYGAGEAYLPIFDLLDRMCKLPIGEAVLEGLRKCAPSWLVSLPNLLNEAARTELIRQTAGTTPELRLREIAAFLEAISQTRTLVLVLEDLHWVDPSTLALISFVARRREPARLMIIATYRENEAERFNHPLKAVKAELHAHDFCSHLVLKLLHQSAVNEYLAIRFENQVISPELLSTVYRRSEGNPLFMVNVTDYLIRHGAIVREDSALKLIDTHEPEPVPETIRELIERQISTLSREDQELLEMASVAGTTFSVAVIARVLGRTRDAMESHYNRLARDTHYLLHAGSRRRPNGRGSPRYRFVHALYQNVLYDRIDESARQRMHQSIGERLEAVYDGATYQIAAELADHFETGGDSHRTAKYILEAANVATAKGGYEEAVTYAKKGLSLANNLALGSSRNELELGLQSILGIARSNTRGFASVEAKEAFFRARILCRKVQKEALRFRALFGLWSFHIVHADLRVAFRLGEQMRQRGLATRQANYRLIGRMAMGISQFYLGHFDNARANLEEAESRNYTGEAATICGWEPRLAISAYKAHVYWFLGYPDRSFREARNGLSLAHEKAGAYESALTYGLVATYFTYSGDAKEALHFCDATIQRATEGGFYHWLALGTLFRGTALCRMGKLKEGIAQLRDGLRQWKATGAEKAKPIFYALEAESLARANMVDEAMKSVQQGLTLSRQTQDFYYNSELWRIKGVVLQLWDGKVQQAQASFQRAIDVARRQRAKSLELRATTALARLLAEAGKEKQGRRILQRTYAWFTEGFGTPDLLQAKDLLDELGHKPG
jgi:predicted ATPase